MERRYQKDLTAYEHLKYWEKRPLGGLLEVWAEQYGDRIAAVAGEEMLTYRELLEKSTKKAFGFQQLGITKGDRVILQLPNGNHYLITLFALLRIGALPVLVLPAHREAELCAIAEKAEPKAYIVQNQYQGFDYMPLAQKLFEQCDCMQYVIVDGDFSPTQACEKRFAEIEADRGTLPEIDPYDTAFFLLSGGSTGVPKLIARAHAEYLYLCRLCQHRCALDQQTVYLVALPCEHNFPMGDPGFLGALYVGGRAVFCQNPSPDEILELITRHGVTITALVPTMANMCIELLQFDDDYDISTLNVLQIGGAMLDEAAADKIMQGFAPATLMQVYGTSEGLILTTRLDDTDDVIRSYQGIALPDEDASGLCQATQIKIVDEQECEVPDGQYGELICKGPYLIDRYYKLENTDLSNFTQDGFYKTGDKAMRTKDGYYKFAGRVKEQINKAGEKIMPAEIEEYLCMHDNIADAAVLGVLDQEAGNRIVAFVSSYDGQEITLEMIYNFLQSKGLAQYKFPDQCMTLETLPLTAVGKKDKKVLLQFLENGE